jgi:IPT/TIG domain
MELRARIRPFARRAAFTAALGALLVPAAVGTATADAAKRAKRYPVVTSVSPMDAKVGDTISIRGRNFLRGKNKNTVVFKRDGARAVFVKSTLGTARQIRVVVPETLRQFMPESTPTRYRLRVFSQRFGKKFTSDARSPRITALPKPAAAAPAPAGGSPAAAPAPSTTPPPAPARVCTGDEDGDLLDTALENTLGLDACKADTDGDGVPDGYEYQSARDLNDDEYQDPSTYLPYPGKRPYPNPLFADAETDYDGDGLRLVDEFRLWDAYGADPAGTLPRDDYRLLYSDGEQYSLSEREGGTGRRRPSQPAATYEKGAQFLSWASSNGYNPVLVSKTKPWHDPANRVAFDIRDVNHNGVVDGAGRADYLSGETFIYDGDSDGYISDDERDEDADGLTNVDELRGRMTPGYWQKCYGSVSEKAYAVAYAGTDLVDRDTDGDGIIDGADDQDHDDIPNIMELSRNMASGLVDWDGHDGQCTVSDLIPTEGPDGPDPDDEPDPLEEWHPNAYGRVNPFNPCLPYDWSRTCARGVEFGNEFAPFDGSTNWFALQ